MNSTPLYFVFVWSVRKIERKIIRIGFQYRILYVFELALAYCNGKIYINGEGYMSWSYLFCRIHMFDLWIRHLIKSL